MQMITTMKDYCKVFTFLWLLCVCLGVASTFEINHSKLDSKTVRAESTDDIHFYLWTQSNSGDTQYFTLINGDTARLNGSPFDATKKTYFITHGYSSNGFTGFIMDAKTKILSLDDCNVISIDWEKLAFSIDYWAAASNVYMAGEFVGTFIDWMVSESTLQTSSIEMTGHSLGAHVIGMAAQAVTTGEIGRLTGLDPAGPAFYDASITERLDKSQANYVDIVHCNGGDSIMPGYYGLSTEMGHTDFFPNGGSKQPGCFIANTVGCSHNRCPDLWVESITAGDDYSSGDDGTSLYFESWPCVDWDTFDSSHCRDCGAGCVNMGFHNINRLEGNYYLSTYESSPYAFGTAQ